VGLIGKSAGRGNKRKNKYFELENHDTKMVGKEIVKGIKNWAKLHAGGGVRTRYGVPTQS